MRGKRQNKVKYNIKNVHYAVLHEDDNGEITWDKPIHIPGAVSLSLSASGEIGSFYADGTVYYQSSSNTGYEGDAEFALIPEHFRINVLDEILDDKGILVEDAEAKGKSFALLFEFDGDAHSVRHVLYKCTAARPSVESSTTEASKDPGTETLSISAVPLPNGLVKARASAEASNAIYSDWYDFIYLTGKNSPSEHANIGQGKIGAAILGIFSQQKEGSTDD